MTGYLVGIDAGTSGVKACVFDTDGAMIGSSYQEYPCYFPKQGWVEQTPEDMVPAVFETCRTAIEKSKINPNDVLGLGMSTQGSVIALMDEHDELIRPFISWQDIRGGQQAIDRLTAQIPREEFYQITGDPLGMLFSVTKYMWLKENEPDNFARTSRFLDQQDYYLRLLGSNGYFTDTATCSRTGMMDIDNGTWSGELHDILGLPLSKRPEILSDAGRVMTHLNAEMAKNMGLWEGCPVVMATFDQNCCTLGAGGVEAGVAVMVMGTFGSCFVVSDESIRDPHGKLVVKPNHGVGNYTIEAFSNTCASSYRWYRDTLGDYEVAQARTSGGDAFDLLNSLVESSPPGSNGVSFLPYLQGVSGAKLNDKAKATFVGMSLGSTKADITRSVMEGICFEMYDIVRAEQKAGIELNGIRLTGGAAKSPLWCQMLADITHQPISLVKTSETGCLGAALYAGIGAEVYADCADAARKAVQVTNTYTPDPGNYSAYEDAYARFDQVYEALAGRVF